MTRLQWFAPLLMVAACGPTQSEVRSEAPRGGCAIVDVNWPAAAADFNQAQTATTVGKLAEAVRADRQSFATDPSGHGLGERLASVGRDTDRNHFVSQAVLNSATRLRQLECAIQRGSFAASPATADKLYGDILSELDAEGQTLASSKK